MPNEKKWNRVRIKKDRQCYSVIQEISEGLSFKMLLELELKEKNEVFKWLGEKTEHQEQMNVF